MEERQPTTGSGTGRFALDAIIGAGLMWLSQPPVAFWPLALVALIPWTRRIVDPIHPGRKGWLILWAAAACYWLLTMQGLRHAHPLMCFPWIALSGYLAVYPVLFVAVGRALVSKRVPLWLAVPVSWVGLECVRNYLLTGISAAMLGHTMADVPTMIQIADLTGTYGVSFIVASINVALGCVFLSALKQATWKEAIAPAVIASALTLATVSYGHYRLAEAPGPTLARFALIQRSEPVEYEQDVDREVEIFQNYARQSVASLQGIDQPVDVVVWPESMFTGGAPWRTAAPDAAVPELVNMSPAEFQEEIRLRAELYLDRVRYVQAAFATAQQTTDPPDLIVGCGVAHYSDSTHVYSGVAHLSDGELLDWYGKTHLVMFGEYVPILPWIPGLRSFVPPGLGLDVGPGSKRFRVGDTSVTPNVCIETAVERVTIQQVAQLIQDGGSADVVVTVTNDGWFDDSAVISHHLRCAQLVAVGCRRPVLSAANNGPTAWINSRGQCVQKLETGSNGAIIATPHRESRASLYVRIGDWPARILALVCLAVIADACVRWWRARRPSSDA